MNKLLVFDWEGENPYYGEIPKDIELNFTDGIITKLDNSKYNGAISHYSTSYIVFKFQEEIKEGFPVIHYRVYPKEIENSKKLFNMLNLPKENLYFVNTPKELGNLVKKLLD